MTLKIFEGIDEAVVEKILLTADERKYESGEMIIHEGEPSNGEGYILKTGKVGIHIGGSKVAELGSGDIFGEIALLNEEKRTATVKALTDIMVIVLTLENLIDMINNDDNTINKLVIRRIEENIARSK